MRGKARLPLPKKTEKTHQEKTNGKCRHDWVAEQYEGRGYCMDCGAIRRARGEEWTEDPSEPTEPVN